MLSATERLMDGLLVEEDACFQAMARALRDVADTTWRRVEVRNHSVGIRGVKASLEDLLPPGPVLVQAVMPPLGDLLATARERTLVVMRRHMKACESTIPARWTGFAAVALRHARPDAADLERAWYDRAEANAQAHAMRVRAEMSTQFGIWVSRAEDLPSLQGRWVAADEVRLPGSRPRGAVWDMRSWMNAEARNASVALTNGLLLSAMVGWNTAAENVAVG